MRKFDIQAAQSGMDQYWSSLSYLDEEVLPQISDSDISGIVFTTDHVLYNRPISRHTPSAIQLDSDPGSVSTADFDDFAIAMLFQASTSDLWIIKFTVGVEEYGVRINPDTSIQLVWLMQDETMDEDGNVETIFVDTVESLIYNEDVSFLSLSRQTNNVTLTLNGQSVTINGAPMLLNDFEFGGGTGEALIDKVTFSKKGQMISIGQYQELFASQRLDTVPRPTGDSTFNYLLDAYTPDLQTIDRNSFVQNEDYYYAGARNTRDAGLWQVIKRASFEIEYSLDNGETWSALSNKTNFAETHTQIMFRHQDTSAEDFWIDIVLTYGVSVPMSYYTAEITGEVYLPTEIGTGYFDADPGDFSTASIKLTPIESGATMKSVELLCIMNDTAEPIFENNFTVIDETITAGYSLYINGEARAFTTIKPNQIYHLVITSPSPIDWIEFNPDKTMGFELVGIGASDVEYSAADAFYIYNTFVGNPILTALEEIDPLVDGVSDSGEPGSVIDIQWNI